MFDDLADVYEAMIDWPKRLAHEEPFYRRLFERLGARSVVDVACGTGRHAAMFHGWGLRVEGADLSPAMIDRARTSFGQPDGLRWAVRAFDEPHRAGRTVRRRRLRGQLAGLAPDMATVQRAIRQMLAAVRGGGAVVIQVLNLWHLPDGPCVWQKCRRASRPGGADRLRKRGQAPFVRRPTLRVGAPPGRSGKWCLSPFPLQGDVLILKGVHRCGTRGYVELVVADPAGGALLRSESTPFLGLEASELEGAARDAGATTVAFYGGYADQPYDRQESVDLLMVAET